MTDFFDALVDPSFGFLRRALIAGLLASVSFGIIGTYVVAKRISSVAGSIAHSVLGGIGAGLYLQTRPGFSWFDPVLGAIIAAVVAAVIIGVISIRARQREDTVIGAIWAIGMATGLLFIARTPGYVDPMTYLFGNILLINRYDLWLTAALDVIIIAFVVLTYHRLFALSFDAEYAQIRGVKTNALYIALLVLTSLTIVALVRSVGVILVIALLTLPAGIAGFFARNLWRMMALAIAFSMLFVVVGLALSYEFDLPSGPMIIICAGVAYIVKSLGFRASGRRG